MSNSSTVAAPGGFGDDPDILEAYDRSIAKGLELSASITDGGYNDLDVEHVECPDVISFHGDTIVADGRFIKPALKVQVLNPDSQSDSVNPAWI